MPAERVAANTDKIKALKEAPSARRKLHRGDGTHGDENSGPLEDLGRSIGMAVGGVFKNSERLDALPKERTPKDVLSDGYDSGGEAGSEQVLALLRSGVSARQSMDLNGASSEYKRAQHLQNGRKASRPTNKYTIWLRMLAKRHGKARLRTAALDIQRCYRGMLAREDAAWHRLQRRKQRAAQETVARQQRERGAARTLQRVMLGHRGRLQANWRRRKRAQRNAAAAVLISYPTNGATPGREGSRLVAASVNAAPRSCNAWPRVSGSAWVAGNNIFVPSATLAARMCTSDDEDTAAVVVQTTYVWAPLSVNTMPDPWAPPRATGAPRMAWERASTPVFRATVWSRTLLWASSTPTTYRCSPSSPT